MRLQHVPANTGVLWFRQSLRLLLRRPMACMVFVFPLLLVSLVLQDALGLLGVVIFSLLQPHLQALVLISAPLALDATQPPSAPSPDTPAPASPPQPVPPAPTVVETLRIVLGMPRPQRLALLGIGAVMAPLSMLLHWLFQIEGTDLMLDEASGISGAGSAGGAPASNTGAKPDAAAIWALLATSGATLLLECWITLASAIVLRYGQPALKSLFAAGLIMLRNVGAGLMFLASFLGFGMLLVTLCLMLLQLQPLVGSASLVLASVGLLTLMLLAVRECLLACSTPS